MLVNETPAGFEFDYELIGDEEIGEIFTQKSAVFVVNIERILLGDLEALFAQSIRQPVFINLFGMSVPVVFLKGEGGFTNLVAEGEDGVFFHFL